MDVHLRDLRYFLAVAEELHFTAAAARLGISQPALSKQIRVLERNLGFALLERGTKGVTLTAAGAALLPQARIVLGTWEQGLTAARAAIAPDRLVVGMQTAVGRGLQRAAGERFAERLPPGSRLSLRLVDWHDPTAGLGDGISDVAFLWLPVPGPEISTKVLGREPRMVALPETHPLAALDRIPFGKLLSEPFVALPPEMGLIRSYWLAEEERGGRPAVIGATVKSAEEAFEAVSAGLGVLLIVAGNAELYRRPGLVYRLVTGIGDAELAVAWRTGDTRAAVREFVDSVGECAEAERPFQPDQVISRSGSCSSLSRPSVNSPSANPWRA